MTNSTPHPNNSAIEISGVSIDYGDIRTIKSISFEVPTGQCLVVLGPSGCGKSTLLKGIAGLVPLAEGQITLNGQDHTSTKPEERNIGFVFQNYALFPHMTAGENVGYALRVKGVSREEQATVIKQQLAAVGLDGFEARAIQSLSGGQQQWVALARTLASGANILLMDEPLSNLDAKLRVATRREIRRLQKSLGFTCIYVTHDQEEALEMADRLAIMSDGVIEQFGTPDDFFDKPASALVAEFLLGAIPFKIEKVENGTMVLKGDMPLDEIPGAAPGKTAWVDPAGLVSAAEASVLKNVWQGKVEAVHRKRGGVQCEVLLGEQRVAITLTPQQAIPEPGSEIPLALDKKRVFIL